jgi:hypothetical protein
VILSTLMMVMFPEMSVLTKATRRHITQDGILHIRLIPGSLILFGKPTVAHPVKKFRNFYGIHVHSRVHKSTPLVLSCARSIQFPPFHHIYIRSFSLPSFHLRLSLPSGLFPYVNFTWPYMHFDTLPFVLHVPVAPSS